MCGRLNIVEDPLGKLIIEITGRGFEIDTRYNVAPTDPVFVLRQDADARWEMRDMRWWLIPYWSKAPTTRYAMFNARAETLATNSAFREPFRHRRGIVPASGYYEWRKQGGIKMPYYIEPQYSDGFAFAALWDRWRGEAGQVIESCTIITAAATVSMADIHSRMPVQLSRGQIEQWVDAKSSPEALAAMLTPRLPGPLRVTPMSTYVNNSKNKGEQCLEPLGTPFEIH
ncbi:MAG: SOS response-associated peptidase [Proteobacteria bacterium]|jgi:putative SOS response-associated peptidase YedK|nr:SOS response-associated peptidase [Pseudomonadota bacterium]